MVEGTQEQPLDAQFGHSLSFECGGVDEKSDENIKISLQLVHHLLGQHCLMFLSN